MQHINGKIAFLHQFFEDGTFNLSHYPTEEMTADILTKGLPAHQFSYLRDKMMLKKQIYASKR